MFNNIISKVSAKLPTDLLPGSISGGIFSRELLIQSLRLDTDQNDSALTTGAKTVANLLIRSSSVAFSAYNPISFPYLAAFTNPILAINKSYEAFNLFTKGQTNEAAKKVMHATAHVALSVFDYWTLGLVNTSKIFDIAALCYVSAGALMDLSKSSKAIHEKVFDPDYIDEDDEDDSSDYSDFEISDGEVRALKRDVGINVTVESDSEEALSCSEYVYNGDGVDGFDDDSPADLTSEDDMETAPLAMADLEVSDASTRSSSPRMFGSGRSLFDSSFFEIPGNFGRRARREIQDLHAGLKAVMGWRDLPRNRQTRSPISYAEKFSKVTRRERAKKRFS